LFQIGNKKLRDIEFYVKNKLAQLFRSRERKKEKIAAKRAAKNSSQNNEKEDANIKHENNENNENNGEEDYGNYDDELIIPDFVVGDNLDDLKIEDNFNID
jgi:hypothetical protein